MRLGQIMEIKLKTTDSQFEYVWGKITSKDDNLADFHLRYLVTRYREDIAARWIMFWRGKAISFAEIIRQSEYEKVDFTDDGRRIVIINKMGMPDKFTIRGDSVVVPSFKGFSSKEEQSEFIALFLDAMTACKHYVNPHKGKTCVAVIGDELQGRLDRGRYLHGVKHHYLFE